MLGKMGVQVPENKVKKAYAADEGERVIEMSEEELRSLFQDIKKCFLPSCSLQAKIC
jgi:hypothetical protein